MEPERKLKARHFQNAGLFRGSQDRRNSLKAELQRLAIAPPVRAAADDANRWNVLFIAIDDLRPERGCYGVAADKNLPAAYRLVHSRHSRAGGNPAMYMTDDHRLPTLLAPLASSPGCGILAFRASGGVRCARPPANGLDPAGIDFQTNAATWMIFGPGAEKTYCINNRFPPERE